MHVGRRPSADRLPGPMGAFAAFQVELRLRRGRCHLGTGLGRPGSSHFHPGRESGNLLGRQLAVRRHLQGDVVVAHGLHQQAFVWFARHNRWACIAANEQRRPVVEQQPSLQLFSLCRMTLVALLDQDGPDLLFEELVSARLVACTCRPGHGVTSE